MRPSGSSPFDRRRSLKVLAAPLLWIIAAVSAADAGPRPEASRAGHAVLGPARDVATIALFGSDPAGTWTPAAGQNVEYVLTPARRLPGFPDAVLEALVRRKDPRDVATPGSPWGGRRSRPWRCRRPSTAFASSWARPRRRSGGSHRP